VPSTLNRVTLAVALLLPLVRSEARTGGRRSRARSHLTTARRQAGRGALPMADFEFSDDFGSTSDLENLDTDGEEETIL
jgi:hypothetical protein